MHDAVATYLNEFILLSVDIENISVHVKSISASGQARCSHETHVPFLGAILNYTSLCADQYLTVKREWSTGSGVREVREWDWGSVSVLLPTAAARSVSVNLGGLYVVGMHACAQLHTLDSLRNAWEKQFPCSSFFHPLVHTQYSPPQPRLQP